MRKRIQVILDTERDEDILTWLKEQPNRSAAIRRVIRSHTAKPNGPTLADLLTEIKELPSRLSVVAATPQPPLLESEEPEAAAANLDGLLDRLGSGDFG